MPNACTECDRSLQGEAGFYLGAIYVNYGITSIVILVTYVVAAQVWDVPAKTRLTICAAIAVLLPLLMFRHARSLWLAMDAYFDPSSQL